MKHDQRGHFVLFDLEDAVAFHEDVRQRHGRERAGLNGAERRIEAGGIVFALGVFEFLQVGVEIARVFELVVVLDK